MYKYSKKTIVINFVLAGMLIFLGLYLATELWYKVIVGVFAFLIFKDAFKELFSSFELTGDRMVVRTKGKVVKEIPYKRMKYLTITRKNKKWIIIADDEGIIFTIKPRIENYKEMVADLIRYNQSNKKMEIHDYIKKTYKK